MRADKSHYTIAVRDLNWFTEWARQATSLLLQILWRSSILSLLIQSWAFIHEITCNSYLHTHTLNCEWFSHSPLCCSRISSLFYVKIPFRLKTAAAAAWKVNKTVTVVRLYVPCNLTMHRDGKWVSKNARVCICAHVSLYRIISKSLFSFSRFNAFLISHLAWEDTLRQLLVMFLSCSFWNYSMLLCALCEDLHTFIAALYCHIMRVNEKRFEILEWGI